MGKAWRRPGPRSGASSCYSACGPRFTQAARAGETLALSGRSCSTTGDQVAGVCARGWPCSRTATERAQAVDAVAPRCLAEVEEEDGKTGPADTGLDSHHGFALSFQGETLSR